MEYFGIMQNLEASIDRRNIYTGIKNFSLKEIFVLSFVYTNLSRKAIDIQAIFHLLS